MDDLNEIRTLAHQFSTEQLRPHVERWDRERSFDDAVLTQLGELGFFGMRIPEAHGGMGFGLPVYLAALEELAWGEPAAALSVLLNGFVADYLMRHATEAQKKEWLEPLATGAALAALALAEEAAGSDLSATVTRAEACNGGWCINGEKRWVVNGGKANLALVLAREAQNDALGTFLLPTDSPGWKITRRETTMGLRPLEMVTVRIDDVRLPGEARVGRGDALAALDDLRVNTHLAIAAVAVGISRAAFEHAHSYAAEREQFGCKLRQFQGIQFKLADMNIRLNAARALMESAAQSPNPRTAASAKVFASETAMWITTQAVQIFGGYGYMRDYPVEKPMRDAKATEILLDTNEILRVRIAEHLYDHSGK